MEPPKPANDPVPIDRLVQEMLATGAMTAETAADLEAMRDSWQAGTLHPDDRDYVVALHGRVLGGGAAPADGPHEPEWSEIDDLRRQLAEALARAEAAEAELEVLREARRQPGSAE